MLIDCVLQGASAVKCPAPLQRLLGGIHSGSGERVECAAEKTVTLFLTLLQLLTITTAVRATSCQPVFLLIHLATHESY